MIYWSHSGGWARQGQSYQGLFWDQVSLRWVVEEGVFQEGGGGVKR